MHVDKTKTLQYLEYQTILRCIDLLFYTETWKRFKFPSADSIPPIIDLQLENLDTEAPDVPM